MNISREDPKEQRKLFNSLRLFAPLRETLLGSICPGANTDELIQTNRRPEDDAADQEPGLRAQPLVEHPAQPTESND